MSSSYGIAELCPNEAFNSLFQRAEQALYVSKNKGGNQISIAAESG